MSIEEFSAQFDVLYNNITSNQAVGLNEYEKSVFLTKAQSQLINEYFNNRTDQANGGFDGSQRRQYDFSSLIKITRILPLRLMHEDYCRSYVPLDKRSTWWSFPQDYFLSVNETIRTKDGQYTIMPISYVEYMRLMMKPYNFPVKRVIWRLITSSYKHPDEPKSRTVVELIGKGVPTANYGMAKDDENKGNVSGLTVTYMLRYIPTLKPIILENLDNYGTDLTIEGETEATECALPVETHQEILERAVTLAKLAWQGNTATQAAAAQASKRSSKDD